MAQTQSAYKNILGTEAELVNQSPVEEDHSDLNFQLMPEIVMLQYTQPARSDPILFYFYLFVR